MDSIMRDATIIEQTLCEAARFFAFPDKFETVTVFDRENRRFLIMDEGWEGFERIHRVWAHLEIRDGKIWIQEDRAQDVLAVALMAAGIPKEQIVLAFQHPARRK